MIPSFEYFCITFALFFILFFSGNLECFSSFSTTDVDVFISSMFLLRLMTLILSVTTSSSIFSTSSSFLII
jgi:hypothetical protein